MVGRDNREDSREEDGGGGEVSEDERHGHLTLGIGRMVKS